MTDKTENIVLEQLRLIRADISAIDGQTKEIDHKVGAIAQTLISVQRDVRDLRREVATLGVAVDEHTNRLDRIERRLGLVDA